MENFVRSSHLYILVAAFLVCFVKPVHATLVLSELNGDTVLYDAGRGFYILPVFNYGDLVFTGDYWQRLSDAQTFASSINYGGVNGWKVHRGFGTDGSNDRTFRLSSLENVDLAYDFGLFGHVDSISHGLGVGDYGFFNDCGTKYGFLDTTCSYQTAGPHTSEHAIYEVYASDFTYASPPIQATAPPSLTLIGLGLLGLVLRRFKKQTI
jgi:hypothetical protein